jgi:hypothetical protein
MATPSRRDLAVEKFNATPQESATRGSLSQLLCHAPQSSCPDAATGLVTLVYRRFQPSFIVVTNSRTPIADRPARQPADQRDLSPAWRTTLNQH